MKYGKYLASQINKEWADKYLDYDGLKKIITALSSVQALDVDVGRTGFGERATSLSMVPNTQNVAKFKGQDITESDFFTALEEDMTKIDVFVTEQLRVVKREVEEISEQASSGSATVLSNEEKNALLKKATTIGAFFLKLEKFVNINYMGIHKILKKHDKMLPVPCRRYYITRLHNQQWVKKDHSKIFVRLGQIHSSLRGDVGGKKDEGGAQGFIRRTTKYWVRTSDISKVKYIVLQHLPVFQHDLEALSGDSQLTNSAYFDNAHLELYHGRLEKSPGAIALRLRWYEDAEPQKAVFMERKTHHDSWTGDVSVKERFTLKPDQV
jgi:SPX domain protein involved in polyphosphate accumulation